MCTETIAAISTGMTNSGIGIVRISGEKAIAIGDRLYKGNAALAEADSHTIHYGVIRDGEEIVDQVLVTVMKAPRTFTGEDTVEINCHGGVFVTKRVLDLVLRSGARPANPGEFTKRAFLHGKMDLSQAEAVMDLISSQSEYALQSSVSQLRGSVKKKIRQLRERILYHTAFIETALDEPEYMELDGYSQRLQADIAKMIAEITTLLQSFDKGSILKEGLQTVILGKPNAGKSTLLNAFSGKEKAIVTDIAGTTRDILEEQVRLGNLTLQLVDTAGLRDTTDAIEKIGVEKARAYGKSADLILYVMDGSAPAAPTDLQDLMLLKDKKGIILLNKTDLPQKVTKGDLETFLRENRLPQIPILELSAKTEQGLQALEEKIEEMFLAKELSFNDCVYITNSRQKVALEEALSSLKKVEKSVVDQMPEDFYSIDLMAAYESLGKITGETIGEELLDEIFSKFCVGK